MNKGLEVLNKMLNARTADDRDYYLYTYADQLEKELKALEIIKTHYSILLFNYYIDEDDLTDIDKNLLKEVLCDE